MPSISSFESSGSDTNLTLSALSKTLRDAKVEPDDVINVEKRIYVGDGRLEITMTVYYWKR